MPKKVYQIGQYSPAEGSQLKYLHDAPPYVAPSTNKPHRCATFLCDCGTKHTSRVSNWHSGQVLSCGCHRKRTATERATTHGGTDTKLYELWRNMIARTHAGGRVQRIKPTYAGVDHCERWDDFANFRDDMAASYFDGAVLARYKDTGDYEPGNCRWVTKAQNSREMMEESSKMRRTSDGRFAIDVAREHGINWHTYSSRITQCGWSIDAACTTPVGQKPAQPLSTQTESTNQ